MELETELIFQYVFELNGNILCRFELENDQRIPLNICIDNIFETEFQSGEIQSIEIHAYDDEIEVYPSEEAYLQAGKGRAPLSLSHIGTSTLDDEGEELEPPADTAFSGRVLQVDYDADADPDDSNYTLIIETLDMTFILETRYEGVINDGDIVHGSARLYGHLETESLLQLHIMNNESSKNNALESLGENIAQLEDNDYQAIIYIFDDGSVLQFCGHNPFEVECVEQIDGRPHILGVRQNDRSELPGEYRYYYYDDEVVDQMSEVMTKERLTEFCNYMITNHSCGSFQTLLTEAAEVCGLHYVDVPFNPDDDEED